MMPIFAYLFMVLVLGALSLLGLRLEKIESLLSDILQETRRGRQ
jgi:hypothetical protein